MFFLSFLLTVSFAILLSAFIPSRSRIFHGLSIYILSGANIILTGFAAHFLNALSSPWVFITFQVILLGIAFFLWFLRRKPNPFKAWRETGQIFSGENLRRSSKEYPVVWVLGIAIFLFYVLGTLEILAIPPNTNDSMTTHLTRAVYWLQHGNLLPWDTPVLFNIIYPVNANLLMLWTMLFTGGTAFAGFVQWSAALAGAGAIFGISRLLGWKRTPSLFASLVWLSLPEILLQSTTTQLDLIVAVFYILSAYFFIFGIRTSNLPAAILSGLALGIAIGTKQTALFLLPGSAILAALTWWKYRRGVDRFLLAWAGASAGFVLLFGSYIYIQNQMILGNPMGDSNTLMNQIGGQNRWGIKENLSYNSARFFYQSLDFTGLPLQIEDNLTGLKEALAKPLFAALNLDLNSTAAVHDTNYPFLYANTPPIQEDRSWYGILGFLLVFVLAPIQFIHGIRIRDPFRVGLNLTSFIYMLCVIALRPGWDPFQGRYFIPVVTLAAPFIASILRPKLGWKILNWAITSYIIFSSVYIVLNNSGKPLLSYPRVQSLLQSSAQSEKLRSTMMSFAQLNFPAPKDILGLDPAGRQLIQSAMMVPPLKLVKDYVPEDASLALGFSDNLPVLPFFGERLTRKLFPVYPPEKLQDEAWFRKNNIDFLLLRLNDREIQNPPAWLIPYKQAEGWALYRPEWVNPEKP